MATGQELVSLNDFECVACLADSTDIAAWVKTGSAASSDSGASHRPKSPSPLAPSSLESSLLWVVDEIQKAFESTRHRNSVQLQASDMCCQFIQWGCIY